MVFENSLPNLNSQGFNFTSEPSVAYNCIAWAIGKSDEWWEPGGAGYYWVDNIPADGSVDSLILLFQSLGFVICESPDCELGFEKIAVYHKNGEYTHATRQLENGKWTSKLGIMQDIEHSNLKALEDGEYGVVKCVMKKKKQ